MNPWKIDDTVPWKIDDTQPSTDSAPLQFLKGAKHAWDRAAYGLENLVTGSNAPAHQAELEANRQYKANTGFAEGLGDFTVNVAGSAFGGIPAVIANSTLLGAVNDSEHPIKGAAIGAGASMLPSALGKTLSTMVKPEAKVLVANNIQPSIGQSYGGMANNIEQKMSSLPLVGGAISDARARPLQEFGEQVVSNATKGNAKSLDAANTYASSLYDDLTPHLKPTQQSGTGVINTLREGLQNPMLTKADQGRLKAIVHSNFTNFGNSNGEQIKQLDSELARLSRQLSSHNASASEMAMADELAKVRTAFQDGLEFGLPAAQVGKLREANRIYRGLIPINKAASSRADEVIMPRALEKALARQAGKDATRMPANPMIDSAKAILPNNVPDSGTAGRLLITDPASLTAGALAYVPAKLANTKTGTRLATGSSKALQRPTSSSGNSCSIERS